jgi:hypothetical protein
MALMNPPRGPSYDEKKDQRKENLVDIKGRMYDTGLMQRYQITEKGLQST